MRSKSIELTAREKKVLEFCRSFIAQNSYSPSIRDIVSGVGINSTYLVRYYLLGLESKGFLKRVPGCPRTIVLTEESNV